MARVFRQQSSQGARRRIDHLHLETGNDQVVGELTADQACAHDQHAGTRLQAFAQQRIVFELVDRQHLVGRVALQRNADRVCAMRQHQLAVVQHALVGVQLPRREVDRHSLGVGLQLHLVGGGQVGSHAIAQLIGLLALGERGGQSGLGISIPRRSRDHHHRHLRIVFAQLLDGGPCGQAAADHDDGMGVHGSDLDHFEISLGHAAIGAGPIGGHIGPLGAWGDAVFGAARGLVINEAAHDADIGVGG